MLSIPAEVLPRFCPDPRSVAALSLTCGTIAVRLRESRPIFKVVTGGYVSAAAESEYFTYTFQGLLGVYGNTMTFYEIIEMEPMWLFRRGCGLMVICTNHDDVLAMRNKNYTVYQLHTVSVTPLLWGLDMCSDTFALGDGSKYSDSVFGGGLCPAGAMIYKRIRDSFCNFGQQN